MAYRKTFGLDGAVAAAVRRESDDAFIPADPANTDWQAYQAWLTAGNAPAEPEPIRPVLAAPTTGLAPEKSAAS